MTSASLAMAWLQLLALLAAEVGLIAFGVALLWQWSPTAAWRRTFCQAGITAVLVVTFCELSGSARALSGWAASALAWRRADNLRPHEAYAVIKVGQGIDTSPSTPSIPMNRRVVGRASRLPPGRLALGLFTTGETPGEAGETPAPLFHSPGSSARTESGGDEVSASRRPTPFRQAFPGNPTATGSRLPDSVSDSMGVLWLWLVWAAGAAVAVARACLAQCLFMIFQLRRRTATGRALAEKVQALGRALGIRQRVRVLESGRLTSPIAFGLIRPTVGLPPDFAMRFDAAKQEAMLAHELAHLAAHDPLWCLLADVAMAVLWWHPGVWWLRRQLHLASEMAADEASLLVADGPRVLAECLVELGARLTGPVLGQLRVSGFRSHLGRRVQRLVHLEGRAWRPPPRFGAAMMRIFGPMAMTVIVVLCTAWAAPQALTTGDSMKMMQMNWKRSLATLALLGAFHGPEASVALGQPEPAALPPPPAPEVAPAPPATPATPAIPSADWAATAAPAAPEPAAAPPTAADAIRERYGFRPQLRPIRQPRQPARGIKTEAKLKQIVLPEISFDGLPLGEVLKALRDESIKRDPDKAGVNFLINPNVPAVARAGVVNPATGLPLAAPAEQLDLASVSVKFNLPLRNVTMKDVLDAIVIVADHPLQYTLEDYAVVFSANPEAIANPSAMPAPLGVVPEPPKPLSPMPDPFRPAPSLRPMRLPAPPSSPGNKPEANLKAGKLAVELADVKPQTFNIDFGPASPSEQVGPAALGGADDSWNSVAVPSNDQN